MTKNTKHWASITAGILSLAGYASAATLGSEKYTYDASGNIVEKSIDGQVTQMTYDSSNRLTERQATGKSQESTGYDAAGHAIAMKDGSGQTTRSMSYGYGEKVMETKNHGTNTGFYYNAEGQLVGMNAEGKVSSYTWDGNVLAADGTQAFTNETHISGGVPILSAGKDVVGSDYLGNTLSSGEQQFTGTAYGEGAEDGRFTGKPYVKELGGYVFQHRLYSPESNRWSTSDPSGFPDGINNQVYVGGDPLNKIDPHGLYAQSAQDQTDVDVTKNGQSTKVTCKVDTRFGYKYVIITGTASNSGNVIYWVADNGKTVEDGDKQPTYDNPANPTASYLSGIKIKTSATYSNTTSFSADGTGSLVTSWVEK